MSWISSKLSKIFGNSSPSLFDISDWYHLLDTSPYFRKYTTDKEKIDIIFSNPALLKVFRLQCDLFSLGEIYVYQNDKELDKDPALVRLNNPNPLQTKSQFLWDYMFWLMLGTAHCYVDSILAENEDNKLYFLDRSKLTFPYTFERDCDKLIFSKKKEKELLDTIITYTYADSTTFKFPLSKLITLTDLTNGVGNWWEGASCIDALYKIIGNSEAALDAKNINTRYSGKFMVAGQADPRNVNEIPMGETEKQDIETKMNGRKSVHAVKSMIDIKRFVENLDHLKLDNSYLSDYFLIGSMYGIPRDVLEAYNSSTYENQEKARASHVSYTLQPKGNDLMNAIAKKWGYDKLGKEIVIDWAHLPFMQVFEKDRASTEAIKIKSFTDLLNQGVSLEEANEYLDLKFTTGEKTEQRTIINQPTTTAAAAVEQG